MINFRFEVRAIRENPDRYYLKDNQNPEQCIVQSWSECKSLVNLGLLNELQITDQAVKKVYLQTELPDACLPPKNETKSAKVLDITLKQFFPGGFNRLDKILGTEIFQTVYNFLPVGWNIAEIKRQGSVLSITFVEEGTPALLAFIPSIFKGLMILLSLVGVITTAWKFFDYKTQKEEAKEVAEKAEVGKIIESNKITLLAQIQQMIKDKTLTQEQGERLAAAILSGNVDILLGSSSEGEMSWQTTALIAVAILAAAFVLTGMINKNKG